MKNNIANATVQFQSPWSLYRKMPYL